jgi:hypothetical protein
MSVLVQTSIDLIALLFSHLEAVWVLVSRPFTTVGLKEKALLVFLADVAV